MLLAAGLVLRVLAQFAYRPVLFYIDTSRYLYNDAPGMDPVGYKGPLRAILAVANFDAVAAVQHLLGLAMAVVLYVLLLRRGSPRWLAALAMAPLLLDAYQIQIEQTLMPDTWFEALIVAGLAILLWRPAPGWRAVAAGGLVLGTSAIFAQVGEALLPAALIYLLALGGGWRRALGRAAALCVAFALPILAYCTVNDLATGNFFLSHTGVTSVYGRMAAAADCATLRLPADERKMCPTRHQQALGPDFLEFGLQSPIRPYYSGLPRDTVNSLIVDFNHRVLTQQPLRVLRRLPAGRGPAVRADQGRQPRGHGHLPLAVPDVLPVLRAARLPAGHRLLGGPGSAGAGPPSGRRPPRSCAPTSCTAGTPRAAVRAVRRWPAWPARRACWCAAGQARPPASPRSPACCCSPRACRCCWSPTCSSSPGATCSPPWSPWSRPARSASAS